jgi:hypothetical protein
MSEDLTDKLPKTDSEKLTLILENTREIKRSLRDLSRKQSVLNDSVLQIHADLRDMDVRLHALEVTRNSQNSST